jgi:Zn-dependent alcohol dehydrogenases
MDSKKDIIVLVGAGQIGMAIASVVMGRRSFAGSNIGGIAETQKMVEFVQNTK